VYGCLCICVCVVVGVGVVGWGGGGEGAQRIADTCGATAVATLIYGKDVYVCWAGDSEAALFSRDGSERHLCVVHKAGLDVRQGKRGARTEGDCTHSRGGLCAWASFFISLCACMLLCLCLSLSLSL
jgi:hypothetical protein